MIIFRTDASIEIGIGHVMRCLRLAKTLAKQNGIECEFICHDHNGNSIEHIKNNGFKVTKINKSNIPKVLNKNGFKVPSGVYVCVLKNSKYRQTKKMILMK